MKSFYLLCFIFMLTISCGYCESADNMLYIPNGSSTHLTVSNLHIAEGDTIKKDSLRNTKSNSGGNYQYSSNCWSNLNFSGELLPYVAVGILVAGAVIVSNDVCYYRSYSFQDQKITGQVLKFSNTYGHTVGLRKTFEHSAIECFGTQFHTFDVMSMGNPYYQNKKYYNLQINYVQQILPKKTPEKLKIYAGPSFNYLNDLGYGGIAGLEYKLMDRVKLDVRYELTTQSNLLRGGIIFTYQKKSPWEY